MLVTGLGKDSEQNTTDYHSGSVIPKDSPSMTRRWPAWQRVCVLNEDGEESSAAATTSPGDRLACTSSYELADSLSSFFVFRLNSAHVASQDSRPP